MNDMPDTPTVIAWAAIFRGYKGLYESTEIRLKEAGLPALLWYDILYEIYSSTDNIQQNQLASRLLLPQYNISRILDKMEEEGVLSRVRSSEDKRAHHLLVTSTGKALLKRMWAVYGATITDIFGSKLSATELQQLTRIMNKLGNPIPAS